MKNLLHHSMRRNLLFFLLFPFFLYSSVCYFTPPEGWQCAQPQNMSPHVQVGFVGKGTTDFNPSINLAFEEVDVSLKEYLKAVKQIHLSQKNVSWRDLGKFKVQAGEGRLTEITSLSPWGEVKMLQAIFVQDHRAYILTAAVLKKEYSALQPTLLQALQSLSLAPDLLSPLTERHPFDTLFLNINTPPQEEELDAWKTKQWEELQKIVLDQGSKMGSHWQFLVLKDGYAKIHQIPLAPENSTSKK